MKHIITGHEVIINCDTVKSYEWITEDTTNIGIKQRRYMARIEDNEGYSICSYEIGGRIKRDTDFEPYVVSLIANFLGTTNKVLDLRNNATLDTNRRNTDATSMEN